MRRLRKRQYHSVADINIANLVDVVLVLLIIFMISAPLLQSGIEVNLPKTRAADISEEAEGIVITIDNKGGIYINDKWARLDGFEDDLRTAMTTKNTSAVYIRGDSAVYYNTAIDVISRIKEMGIEEIGLVTARKEDQKKARGKR
jgi:biopolymer transport protein TolR